jgi:predicted DNA-binding ribbon-helix-helix protein
MRNNKKGGYEVGYGKPPVATRWQKGQSGNPNGKPKRIAQELDPGKILQSIDNEELYAVIDGKRKPMKKAEIHFQQLFTKAIRGDLTVARLIAKMANKYFGPEAEGPSETILVVVPDESGRNENTDFRRGRSGKSKGRPRQAGRQVSAGFLFRKVAKEQVSIEVDGRRVTMSRWDAYVRQIYAMALNKNNSAGRLLDQLRRHFPGDLLPGDPVVLLITEDDARL